MPLICLRDNAAVVCIFLWLARYAAVSLGGVPCGVQDRVREREEGFFAANQCRHVCDDWALVAAILLVLPLIGWRTPRCSKCRASLERPEHVAASS